MLKPDKLVAGGSDLLDVPVGTFRKYVEFIAAHDLWDEATKALAAEGIKSLTLSGGQLEIVRALVEAKGSTLGGAPAPICAFDCAAPGGPKGSPTS